MLIVRARSPTCTRPDCEFIADEISVTLSRRVKHVTAGIAGEGEGASVRSVSWLVGRIRNAFELP